MQSKNEVVILGQYGLKIGPLGFQTLFFTFTMLWMCPGQIGVDLIEESIYHKLEKMERSNRLVD